MDHVPKCLDELRANIQFRRYSEKDADGV